MADADDRDAQASLHCNHEDTKTRRTHEEEPKHLLRASSCLRVFVVPVASFHQRDPDRPTMQMPASSAALMIASPSIISVFPASTDRTRRAGGLHRLDRRDADHRHVEPHVLVRLRDLDDADAGAGELAGARDHRVGAFHRLDRDDRRRLHRDRLADVEAGDGVGDAVAERRGRACSSSRRRAARQHASPRQQRREERRRDRAARCRWSRSTSAMPRDERVGVPASSAASARRAASRSGTMTANSLVCLTWPAITACVDAGVLQQLDAACRAGRARSSGTRRRAAARRASASSGNVSSLSAMTVTSWPGAARRVEDQEREAAVAGDET